MSAAEAREIVKKAYPGPNWAKKVDKMSDAQVIAVRTRLQNEKKKEN